MGIGMCLYSDTHQSVVGVHGCMFVHERCQHVCWSIRVLCVCVVACLSMSGYQHVAVRVLWVCMVVCLSVSVCVVYVLGMCVCLCMYAQLYSGAC